MEADTKLSNNTNQVFLRFLIKYFIEDEKNKMKKLLRQ